MTATVLNVIGLSLGALAAVLMWVFPPRVQLYTDKGEPVVSFIGNATEQGLRRAKWQSMLSKISIPMLVMAFALQLPAACSTSVDQDFKIGDCLIRSSGTGSSDIVQIVATGSPGAPFYKVFTSLLADGKLVQAQDYQSLDKQSARTDYAKVACPRFQGVFSPDAYLSGKQK